MSQVPLCFAAIHICVSRSVDDGERLYELTDFDGEYGTHEIEIIFDEADVELFAWTFG